MKENKRGSEGTAGLGNRNKALAAAGILFLPVVLFAGIPWFLPLENEVELKRSSERLKIKADVDEAQKKIMSRLDMDSAFDKEAEYMMKAVAAPVREAAQKARPLPLAADPS